MQPNGILVWNPGNAAARGGFLGGVSGSLAGAISADTDLYSLRNGHASRPLVVSQIDLQWTTTTAFGAAQALLFGVYKVTGFTVIHDTNDKVLGGVAKRTSHAIAFEDVEAAIATTAAMTGHTYTAPDADEPLITVGSSSHATTPMAYGVWVPDVAGLPLVLEPNEGLVVRPLIALGATGVGILSVHPQVHVPG